MRVFILSPDIPSPHLLRSLVAQGVEPVVARARVDGDERDGVRYVRVAARGDGADPISLRWSRRAVRSAVRETTPALLHVVGDPWTPTAEVGAAAGRDLRLPYVVTGTSVLGGPRGFTARWQSRRVIEGAVALAGINRAALDHLARGSTGRPTGIIPLVARAAEATTPRPASRPVTFGAIGRLVHDRGIDVLLTALGQTYGDWRLRIAGTGPAQEALETQAQRLGLGARLEWLGALPREDLGDWWRSIDVLVVPSRVSPAWEEPTAQSVLDGMATGVAAVVSRSGALPDAVGEAGYIVEPGDADALARALQGLVEDRSRVVALGRAAAERMAERHSDEAVAGAMVALWRRAVTAA